VGHVGRQKPQWTHAPINFAEGVSVLSNAEGAGDEVLFIDGDVVEILCPTRAR
jgi:hypothetical protein